MGILAEFGHILAGFGYRTDPAAFCVMFGLILARVVTAISLAPFLGGKAVPSRVKVGLGAMIAAILYTSIAPPAQTVDLNTLQALALVAKEGVIGAMLGFLAQVVFNAVQMAGALIDIERGMSQATFFAPQLESQVSLFGNVQFQSALVLFLVLNGHLMFIRALAASYDSVPLLAFPAFGGNTLAMLEQLGRYTASALLIAAQFSAPVLLALFLVDAAFGMVGRAASGFQVHHESQPVKAILGLAIALFALVFVLDRLPTHFAAMLREIANFMARMA
jgi:flagellar biosynthetic protein FliR